MDEESSSTCVGAAVPSASDYLDMERLCWQISSLSTTSGEVEWALPYSDATTDHQKPPIAHVGESVTVIIVARNDLDVYISVIDAVLDCLVELSDRHTLITDAMPTFGDYLRLDKTDAIGIGPKEEKEIHMRFTPMRQCSGAKLTIRGIRYGIGHSANGDINRMTQEVVYGWRQLLVRGRRMNETKLERCGIVYGADYRLRPSVAAVDYPLLNIHFEPDMPSELHNCVDGELVPFKMRIMSTKAVAVGSISLCASPIHCVSVSLGSTGQLSPVRCADSMETWLLNSEEQQQQLSNGALTATLWIRAPTAAATTIRIVVCYGDGIRSISLLLTHYQYCRYLNDSV